MRKELLINVTPPETRAAITEDDLAVEVFHERGGRQSLVGNVYLGRVHRVLPGMQAAFVSIGLDRDAFLYVQDVIPRAVEEEAEEGSAEEDRPAAARPRIDDLLREGQELVVQVTKDPLSGKGPRVTANVSLPGRKLVYLPRALENGVSRRITDDAERERLREILEGFGADGGFIARTAAQGRAAADFLADWQYLTDLAERLRRKSERASAPLLLHRELDLPLRLARDFVSDDFAAIRVDEDGMLGRLSEFLRSVSPALAARVAKYDREEPIFDFFGVEEEIEKALASRVALSSGGSVVIHETEALVAIDVNTGKFVGTDALEDTVFAANLDAVTEIARQIRLRDLGGLLVVDFIDMEDPAHRQEVFDRFEEELARDRARTRILQISEFGLIEVTRQRSRGNLEKTLTRACPACAGSGRVRSDLTVALDLRRALLAPGGLYAPGETVRVRVRPTLAHLLEVEQPNLLADASARLGVEVALLPDETLPPDGFEIISS